MGTATGPGRLIDQAARFCQFCTVDKRDGEDYNPNPLVIPISVDADWYARRVGVAAAREIKEIPAGRPSREEPVVRPAGIT